MEKVLPTTLPAFLMMFIKKFKWGFIALTILHLAWAIDSTIAPYAFKLLTDRILAFSGDKSHLWAIVGTPILIGAGVWITTDIMFRLYDWRAAFTLPPFEAGIRMTMFHYVQGHSYNYFANNFAGSIANKISDMPESATRLIQLLITLFIPTLVAFIIAMSIYTFMHPVFAIIMFVWFLIHMSICFFHAQRCNQLANNQAEARSTLTGKIVDSFGNHSTVKLFARQPYEHAFVNTSQQDEKFKHKKTLLYIAKMRRYQSIACFLMPGALLVTMMLLCWQRDIISSSEFVYLFYSSWNITIMSWIAGVEMPNFFKEAGTCLQALSIIKHQHEINDSPNAHSLVVQRGTIQFKQVCFSYHKNKPVFSHLDVQIDAGEKVGLVGFSGSGKTTFVNLCLRFFDLQQGHIYIDDQDIATVTRQSLRESIAMIPQDPTLFHRTLLENIRYGRLDASDKEVLVAAKRAHCDEFIKELPQGYETLVGERGVKLSGGQRQRIAIARTILKDAPILILDEATSALDSVTEKLIHESLHQLMADRTTVVIAHRLSTLAAMDRLLVFTKGELIEEGSHTELLTKAGHYAHLWHMQAGGFLPEQPGGHSTV